MKYKTIDLLDSKIEKIIKKRVVSYYTDWKNNDRPYYMKLKGSNDPREKICMLVVRKYGTYLYTYNDFINYSFPLECIDYYFKYERENSDFYMLDINDKRIDLLNDIKFMEVYARLKRIKEAGEIAA